jgi:glyoxylase-like metal-dependent hydrolase (beta-lactamase superfamily II)
VHTVIVTHSHPDHFGTAGRLTVEAGADLVTHASFDTWFTRMEERPTTTAWGGDMTFPESRWREHVHMEWVPPVPTVRVEDQGSLELGGRRFVGVHTPGHTKDHLCLHDPENGVLLSGDHVLPTITPHISGAFGDAVDPLADFFASLEKVAKLNVSRVLPAHGHPFDDLAGRTKAIHEHHLERLDRLVAAAEAAGSATVEELSHELFRERHWGFMAESETYAHLEHLRMLGRAERFEDAKGKTRYRVA